MLMIWMWKKWKTTTPPPQQPQGTIPSWTPHLDSPFFLVSPHFCGAQTARWRFLSGFVQFPPILIHIVMNFHSCGGAAGAVALASHDAVGTGPNDTHHLFKCGLQWRQVISWVHLSQDLHDLAENVTRGSELREGGGWLMNSWFRQ